MISLFTFKDRKRFELPQLITDPLKAILIVCLTLFSFSTTYAQVVLTEVFSDGTFALTNTGDTDVDVSSYWACNFPAYEQLENLMVECGSLVIPAGDELVISGFNQNFNVNASEFGLYINSGFSSPDNILSYVDWGTAGGGRSSVAVAAGIWTDGDVVPAFAIGESIRFDGEGIQAADWSVQGDAVFCNDEETTLEPLEEARSIVALGAQEAGKTVEEFNGANRSFPENYYNFLPSVIELADLRDPNQANATIPLYEGVGPNGEPTYFIITEATSIALAQEYGAIVSPKLIYGNRPDAAASAQYVDVVDGRIHFKGDVDFSPERIVTAGSPNAFPPAFVQPGAVGDAEYSSLVVLPSGEVINAQIVANATGVHDRINEINIEGRWANFQLLDGWEGGDQFYYHLVTDASDPGPAAIELGVYAPRMANLPTFGVSGLEPETVLLGFSPNVNGLSIAEDGVSDENRQGLGSTILDNDLDPVNIFPFDPDNTIEAGNNYSPMWDAHLNMWTDEAINGAAGDQRRAITSFADLFNLIDQGLVTSFAGSPGIENDFVNGLRASHAVINCPVICHPFQGENDIVIVTPLEEARSIVALGAQEAGKTVEEFNGANRSFPENYYNFLPSVIELADLRDPNQANATIPLYEGVGPNGEPTYFIITEATSIALAQEYGAIVSPKLIYGNRPEAAASAQRVEVVDGRIHFKGDVDFSPERIVTAGSPNAFPPAFVQPGAVGDAEYSSLVVLPSGEVINAQIVANATGVHDRINEINIEGRWANFQLLDGWEGGDQFYYHLVTDASDPGPAAIELGVYAPRMANLPTFGVSGLEPETVLLGFSPNVNGLSIAEDGVSDENRQGLGSTILDNDLDPVNIFPFDPDNTIEAGNNYSPMWDAHLNMWTDEAINGAAGDQRRAITSFADLFNLIDQGLVTSFAGSPGIENDFVNGLRASHAVINCPVICHPFQGENDIVIVTPLEEARSIVALGAQEAGKTVEEFNGANRSFPENYYNFLPSVIELADLRDPNQANATIPLYEGVGPNGEPTYFIITEATSIALAQEYGAIVSPKLIYGNRPDAAASAQRVEVVDGRIHFKGDVDFSPERIVTAGSPNAFPPAFVQPGAVGDAEYSSLVVLPSGEVINAQIVANATGVHDRINEINIEGRWANFQLLDGWEGGDQFYYHLVTDASDPGPAAIELGVYAPRMANLPTFGVSGLEPETVLLGFSPNVNGLSIAEDGVSDENRQGLGSTILDNDLDPVNIFPFDPDNTIEAGNNYSPMWDAHLNMWTDEAINGAAGDQRRAITSFADLFNLIDQGLVTSFAGSPGIENDFVNGLRASHAVINCPVICHPFQGENDIVIVTPLEEARSIVALGAQEAGKTVEEFNGANRSFPENYYNFLPSVIELADLRDPNQANATIPLYEGVGPNGEPTYFIITEATSIALAQEYGAIVSPKLIYGNRPEAAASAQRVEVVDGRIHFKGDVDFSPERIVTAGSPNAFPPAFVQPGAVGDAEYSSLVVLPSGEVINAQIVANATGVHDRINEINIEGRWANFQLLDGWEGGDQFYYHLVTDASDPGPAAIELGVYAPRMANLPTFGVSGLEPETVLLGFSPNVNGLSIAEDGVSDENRQGLGSTILDNDLDPVNIFPFDPDNTIEAGNNYSPMWDAHLNMWTDEAINGAAGDQRRAITSFADLFNLIDQGLVTSFAGSPGIENDFVNGLRASHAVINCPVICHPFQGENDVVVATPLEEARSIVELGAQEAGKTVTEFNGANRSFPENYYNFLPSVIALNDLRNPHLANATIPLYEGVGPNGEPTYFIITEATSIALAQEYGAIVSPKLIYGNRPEAAASAQRVEVVDGRIHFKGDVDFSPERIVTAGSPNAFPPAFVQPGAVGDAEYSSMVVLPSGEVINAQIVANASGVHDRINEINIEERWANFQLLDGWEGGDQYYYHLVTDASDPGPAAIELGVYAPRMANLPVFGQSELDGETVLLGFSPNVNGLSATENGETGADRQGLGSTLVDNDLDPVNIFPLDPDNSIEAGNNYSPMWDAHLNMWTDEAINGPNGDQRRAITSFADLFNLIDQGLVTSFAGSPGIENDFVGGLRASHAVINCPVICHPFQGEDVADAPVQEARAIVELGAQEASKTVEEFNGANRSFPENYYNFLPSVIELADLRDPNQANATLPLYEGVGPNGEPTYFIITEATSIALAQEYGAIVSPKLIYGNRANAAASAQRVEIVDGRIHFKGDVDFSPERIVTPGSPNAFPPAFVQPGAVGDAEYSSMVVLPSGEVINAQIVANATGVHDRINEINIEERWANFQLLDGWEGGDQFYYHLVTDASDPGPAAIELGVYAPRMANLPTFGNSELDPETVLLGFSPNVNGLSIAEDGVSDENRQGLGSTILDNDLDPVNIFPFDPDNTIEAGNNYSPMWDAHLNMWTDEAINGAAGDQRRAITSFADLFNLIDQGLVTSFAGSPGIENDFVGGLRASHAVINCPVICHPFQGENVVGAIDGGDVFTASGATSLSICSGDNVSNIIQFANNATNDANVQYAYIFAYDDGAIGGLVPTGLIELEGSPTLNARMYGIAYTGDLIFNAWDNIETTALSSGQFDLSTNFVDITIQNGGCSAAADSELTIANTNAQSSKNLQGMVHLTEIGIVPSKAVSQENGIKVYPNPTQGQISVNISQLTLTGNLNVIISDVTGRQLTTQKVDDGSNPVIRMDVSNLQNGLYFISVFSEGKKVRTMKIPLVKLY